MQLELNMEEHLRIERMLTHERELWEKGPLLIAGLDEVGRGPLAGPVVAAAVVFSKGTRIPRVDDSKKLTSKVREELFATIIEKAMYHGIGVADVSEIDDINIYHSAFLAMHRSIEGLGIRPDHLLVDGRSFDGQDIPYSAIVKGDSLSFTIAAASILAKVTRDRVMLNYDREYPQYGFRHHKGYATQQHLDAIKKYGFCAIHRRSFQPKVIKHIANDDD